MLDINEFSFCCPYCSQDLSTANEIVLNTKRKNGDIGSIHLNTTFGNYSYTHFPAVQFEKGEVVDFLCPNCRADLKSTEYKNFAQLKMKVEKDIDFDVIFSREAGKRKTYVITEDGIESYFGD
jgi:uncharacterized protein YbaR (Trm112 family)